jgi:serine/threonine protein kinase
MSTAGRTRAVSHDQVDSDQFHLIQIGYNRFFIDRRYSDLKPAGDGSYGFVASALDTVTGERVAIKKIKDVFHDVVDAKRILREMKLLRHFNSHENIISIIGIYLYIYIDIILIIIIIIILYLIPI